MCSKVLELGQIHSSMEAAESSPLGMFNKGVSLVIKSVDKESFGIWEFPLCTRISIFPYTHICMY